MHKIPSLIPNIVFIGEMNAGKSSLINAITNQNVSIVSDIAGTTTDEVTKRFELLNIGPVNFIDTAGYNDLSELGHLRKTKTMKALEHASLVIYVVDSTSSFDLTFYDNIKKNKILVFNKSDLLSNSESKKISLKYPSALLINSNDKSIDLLIEDITNHLNLEERNLLDNIILDYNKIVHVIPIDSEAPKGRLILPQMQLIRECLDLDLVSIVITEHQLEEYLNLNNDIGLIVTDSKIFGFVSKINKQRFNLTSYSILQANQKGDLQYFVDSIKKIPELKSNAKVLVMESCSHNKSHEDIGTVMIPKIIKEIISNEIEIDFRMAKDFGDNLSEYDLIIHCGSCMLSRDVMINRITKAKELNIPMTNYGLMFAYKSGILEEAIKIYNISG